MSIENILGIILIIVLIGVILYYLVKNRISFNKLMEGFDPTDVPTDVPTNAISNNQNICKDISLTGLLSNPLIDRNSSNVIINPSGAGNIVLGTSGLGCWSDLNDITNASIVINLNKMSKIEYIITHGLKYFKVYFSKTDNDTNSYEEILYKDTEIISNNNRIYFTASSFDGISKFNNLITSDGQSIFAKFIKIIPVKSDESFINPYSNSNPTSTSTPLDNTIGPNGVKIEIMGYSNDSKISQGGESLIGSCKFYNINGDQITQNWISEPSNKDPRLRIVFEENGIIVPKTIYSFKFSSSDNSTSSQQWIKEFSVNYLHNKSKVSDTIYNIKGNTNCGKNEYQYYFETPIIATELIIRPTQMNSLTKPAEMKITDIFGSQITQVQEKVLLDKSKQKYCSADNPDGCGSVSDLLGKQSEIQQLCDALELQDQIKENNQRIQKNRQYIMQLEDHDKKIANLEEVVDKMKHLRTLRQKATDSQMTDQKATQSATDKQLQELVEERRKSQSQFNVKLNIQPGSLAGLETLVQNVQAAKGINPGNDTATTPLNTSTPAKVEGFTNYNSNYNSQMSNNSINNILNNIPEDPFNNRWLDHKFKLKMDEKTSHGFSNPTYLERQFEQNMNKGFNYTVYQDNTFKNQMNNNNRLFKKDNQFLEEKVLSNNIPTLDHNVKFVKMM